MCMEECCVLRWRDESLCELLDDTFGQLYFFLKLVTMKVISVDEGVAWCLLQQKKQVRKKD